MYAGSWDSAPGPKKEGGGSGPWGREPPAVFGAEPQPPRPLWPPSGYATVRVQATSLLYIQTEKAVGVFRAMWTLRLKYKRRVALLVEWSKGARLRAY